MSQARLNILQVSTADALGGAERVAWNLFQAYRRRGHTSRLAVGRKQTDDPDVLRIDNAAVAGPWGRRWWHLHGRVQPHYRRTRAARVLCRLAHRMAEPGGVLDGLRGIEDFRYPGSRRLLGLTDPPPDIVHCHNLHGKYFDLDTLPSLSRQVPVMLTLHDAWLLSGHCAHSLGCDRWETGCGQCPDLAVYPPLRRDATAYNWRRKRDIFSRSRLYVATPSRWLMEIVQRSMLAQAIVEARVIPNGVDSSIFKPADRRAVRALLGLPRDAFVLLCAGCGVRGNAWKDYATMQAAAIRLAGTQGDTGRQAAPGTHRRRKIIFVALGGSGPEQTGERSEPIPLGPVAQASRLCSHRRDGGATIHWDRSLQTRVIPFEHDPATVARHYQAADIYVHAARADTFPNTVLESLACGTPVVATATGGIPEQVRAAPVSAEMGYRGPAPASEESATGILTRKGNAATLSDALGYLLARDALRRNMGACAADDAKQRFGLPRQATRYLEWYAEVLGKEGRPMGVTEGEQGTTNGIAIAGYARGP